MTDAEKVREAARFAVAVERNRKHSQDAQERADEWDAALAATAEPACPDCLGAGYVEYGERVTAPCICSAPSSVPRDAEPPRCEKSCEQCEDAARSIHGAILAIEAAPRDAERESMLAYGAKVREACVTVARRAEGAFFQPAARSIAALDLAALLPVKP